MDDGRIHYANDAFRTLFGYSLNELTSEVADVFALFPVEDRDSFESHLADLYIHGTTAKARKAKLLRRDGGLVDAEIWVAKVNHQRSHRRRPRPIKAFCAAGEVVGFGPTSHKMSA